MQIQVFFFTNVNSNSHGNDLAMEQVIAGYNCIKNLDFKLFLS